MVEADKKADQKFKGVVNVFLNTKPQPRTDQKNSKPPKKSKPQRKSASAKGNT